MSNIKETLAERETQHGPFKKHAEIECSLYGIITKYNDMRLNAVQLAALRMIMHKIARILNRGSCHSDTWHDIAGYATLVERSILDE